VRTNLKLLPSWPVRFTLQCQIRHVPDVLSHFEYIGLRLFASPVPAVLCKMTSSIKPEIHNVSQRRQKRTQSQVTCAKKGEDRMCSSEDMFTDRQTDTQTDRHAHHNTHMIVDNRHGIPRTRYTACDQLAQHCCHVTANIY